MKQLNCFWMKMLLQIQMIFFSILIQGKFIDEKEHKFYELLADTENSTN